MLGYVSVRSQIGVELWSRKIEGLLAAHSRRGVTIHDLRRTAGARKYRATGAIALVSNFLGHANSRIKERHYVHIRLDDLQAGSLTAEAPYEEKERQVREQLAA